MTEHVLAFMIQLFKRHIGDFDCSISSLSVDMPKREENKIGSFSIYVFILP